MSLCNYIFALKTALGPYFYIVLRCCHICLLTGSLLATNRLKLLNFLGSIKIPISNLKTLLKSWISLPFRAKPLSSQTLDTKIDNPRRLFLLGLSLLVDQIYTVIFTGSLFTFVFHSHHSLSELNITFPIFTFVSLENRLLLLNKQVSRIGYNKRMQFSNFVYFLAPVISIT